MLRRIKELTLGLRAMFWSVAWPKRSSFEASGLRGAVPGRQEPQPARVQTFSQSGEDGIIAEIFRRIGEGDRQFIEIGVGDGLENNTAALLVRGWSGCWLECDARSVRKIRRRFSSLLQARSLKVARCRVTAQTVDSLLQKLGAPVRPDLLSIDIDGHDYWVWESIRSLRPRVVVIEYNASFPPPTRWVMAPSRRHRWRGTTYRGASLASLVELAGAKATAW